MTEHTYKTRGTCSSEISFALEGNVVHNVKFTGGCPGNTLAVSKLVEGMEAQKLIAVLKGNLCGARGTSCADQLARAVEGALGENK